MMVPWRPDPSGVRPTGPHVCLEDGGEQGEGAAFALTFTFTFTFTFAFAGEGAPSLVGWVRSSSERAYVPVCARGRAAGGSVRELAYEPFEVVVRSLWLVWLAAAGDRAWNAPERNELRARAGGKGVRRAMFNGATMICQPIRKRGAEGRGAENR
jgi:hypothetical protein